MTPAEWIQKNTQTVGIALAVVLAFAIEAWFKAAYQSIAEAFARP